MSSLNIIAVIPARDEAQSITSVIHAIKTLLNDSLSPLFARIVVCDNASSDDTAALAEAAGAEVVSESIPGYGAACLAALSCIDDADIVVFFDADESLDISETRALLTAIEQGADLVVGTRPIDKRETGSMTAAQIFGNHLASLLIRLIWQKSVTDLGPFRAIRYRVLQNLHMRDRAYGWTVEMQVKAIQHHYQIVEVPVTYRCRIGRSKISGTIRGTIGAGYGIISTILKLAIKPPANIENNRTS